ncbi:MAG TPA: peptidoglycan-binding domain-containing protein [Chthoniobacterales bacterium]
MKAPCILWLLFFAVGTAWADDSTRALQQKLKDQGFYYGDVSGQPGPETAAALRRYQIRYGLRVTGEVNDETLRAMGLSPRAAPQAPRQVEPKSGGDTTPRPYGYDRDPRPERGEPLEPRGYAAPPGLPDAGASQSSRPGLSSLLIGTVYEGAPWQVQENLIYAAQGQLARRRFYFGEVDGQPGPATVDAIARFQQDENLPVTARLDQATLNELQLLPGQRYGPPSRFSDDDNPGFERRPPRRVYRGVWIN